MSLGIIYLNEIGNIIKYPNKIDEDAYDNREFNKGLRLNTLIKLSICIN